MSHLVASSVNIKENGQLGITLHALGASDGDGQAILALPSGLLHPRQVRNGTNCLEQNVLTFDRHDHLRTSTSCSSSIEGAEWYLESLWRSQSKITNGWLRKWNPAKRLNAIFNITSNHPVRYLDCRILGSFGIYGTEKSETNKQVKNLNEHDA